MKLQTWKWIAGLSALALVTAACPILRAECGLPNKPIKPSSWSPLHGTTNPQFVASALIDFEEPGPSIVGMWHVIFTAHSSGGLRLALSQPRGDPHSCQNWRYSGIPPHSEQDEAIVPT